MRIGFIFPGQGAQRVGMAADIGAASPLVNRRLEMASEALGFDLAGIVAHGPEERLNSTEVTQPALLAVSIGLHDAWLSLGGPAPSVVAGHSLGEYSALTAAGALEYEAAVRLVYERGKAMQAAVPAGEGRMAAILGLEDDAVAECCAGVAEGLGVARAANFNAPGQVVVAGAAAAVDAAVEACRGAGARRAVPLDVSVPSHCPLMAPASERLAALLDEVALADPRVPVVQNVTAVAAEDAATVRENLLRQLVSPVRWSASVSAMVGGVDAFVECGPGNVLAGLARRIDRRLAVHGIGTPDGLDAALAACGTARGA